MRHTAVGREMDWERPSERYLAYLARLTGACVERDRDTIDRLMRLRLASHLPRGVLDEIEFFRRARDTMRAPLKLMRHAQQARHLALAARDEAQLRLDLRAVRAARAEAAATGSARRGTSSGLRRAARRR